MTINILRILLQCLLKTKNIDTDQIIPSRFLKLTNKIGFGDNLFRDWRYNKKGEINNNFILNKKDYKKREILITGSNFGCGSSREHAVWAILDYGFKAVVANSVADIFKNNALNNGLLIVEISSFFYKNIKKILKKHPNTNIIIKLKQQEIKINDFIENFEINAYKKKCLLKGYDDIDFLIKKKNKINEFEINRKYFYYNNYK